MLIIISIILLLSNINYPFKNYNEVCHGIMSNSVIDNFDDIIFIPDTTVNEKLYLNNYNSIMSFYPCIDSLYLHLEQDVYAFCLFANISHTQYLKAFIYEGSLKNEFSLFEIGYLNHENIFSNGQIHDTKYSSFKTESGLSLGMDFESVLSVKGNEYDLQKRDKDSLIIYRIEADDISGFCKKYNMPSYSLCLTIKNSKVNKIVYGFDYP